MSDDKPIDKNITIDPFKDSDYALELAPLKFGIGDRVKAYDNTVGRICMINPNRIDMYAIQMGGVVGHFEHYAEVDLQLVTKDEDIKESLESSKVVPKKVRPKKMTEPMKVKKPKKPEEPKEGDKKVKLKSPVYGVAEEISVREFPMITVPEEFIKGIK